MKLTIESPSLQYFHSIAQFGMRIYTEFEEPLTKMLLRDALESLIIKLAKAQLRLRNALQAKRPVTLKLAKVPVHKRNALQLKRPGIIKITLTFTSAEAFSFSLVAQYWNKLRPNSVEYLVVSKAISNQLNMLV